MRPHARSLRRKSVYAPTQFTAAAAAIGLPQRHPPATPFPKPALIDPASPTTAPAPPAADAAPDYDNPQWRLSDAGTQAKATSSTWFVLLIFGLPVALLILAAALQGQ